MKQKPLITKLDAHWKGDVGPGWHALLDELHEKILAVDPDYKIVQVKEKFGGLRFYTESTNPKTHDLEIEYETKSYEICEECGREGRLHRRVPGGWVRTLCSDCATKCNMEPCTDEDEVESDASS